ncbi:MAG: hypothetical protein MIO92_14750, partial [Methanosarcinaceae archaeon]|nr:hypothetical protein [Methanosarcinaceae archaeon]
MNDATKRWIRCVVRQQPAADADTAAFRDWMAGAVTQLARLRGWPLSREDCEDVAQDYVARLFQPAFRPAWRQLMDEALERKINGDLYGNAKHDGFIAKALKAKLKGLPLPLTDREAADGSMLERPEPAAVRFYRSSPDKALRGYAARDDEAAGYAELEGVLLTFQLCLREYRDCEWPAA